MPKLSQGNTKPKPPLTTIIDLENEPEYEAYATLEASDQASNPLEVDLEDDCGYKGDVNVEVSVTEYVPGSSSNEVSDGESWQI